MPSAVLGPALPELVLSLSEVQCLVRVSIAHVNVQECELHGVENITSRWIAKRFNTKSKSLPLI